MAVVDPDVHHGNGTQEIFYDHPEVLYASLHRFPFYPGSGAAEEIGRGEGRGRTLNIPLPVGVGDAHYLAAADVLLLPALEAFAPDAIVISAGYDALAGDPLGGMSLSPEGLAALWFRLVRRWPCMAVLEGGYALGPLRAGLEATARVLTGAPAPDPDGPGLDAAWEARLRAWRHPLLGAGDSGPG